MLDSYKRQSSNISLPSQILNEPFANSIEKYYAIYMFPNGTLSRKSKIMDINLPLFGYFVVSINLDSLLDNSNTVKFEQSSGGSYSIGVLDAGLFFVEKVFFNQKIFYQQAE